MTTARYSYGIGVMSGTSLDGLDVAFCHFEENNNKYNFKIIEAETFSYTDKLRNMLKNANYLKAKNFLLLHNSYGRYIGKTVKYFCKKYSITPDFISSHGHTIFHIPSQRLTFQLGNGAEIYSVTGIPCVSDFRTLDVALGGQGAPLVPIGDKYLFSEYEATLNLGGFSNITIISSPLIASDICPVNFILNHYAQKLGYEYDENGNLAKEGELNEQLLAELNSLELYKTFPRHSLSREIVEQIYFPLINQTGLPINTILRTLVEHIAIQITKIFNQYKIKNILVTGGGTYNSFLLERVQNLTTVNLIIPDKKIIEFKEALIFCFLGWLKLNGKINIDRNVTNAERDSSSGVIYGI